MLGELSYALPASAQYMKKREEIYWTSGANVYAANGIRTMRVNISGQGFLDMSSLVLECDCQNLSTFFFSKTHPPWTGRVFSISKGINQRHDLRGNRRS